MIRYIPHLLAVLLLLAACDTDSAEAESAERTVPESVDSTAAGHNAPVDWRAALLKLPIAFPAYTAHYQAIFPDFGAEAFERVDSTRVEAFLTAGSAPVDSLDAQFGPYLVPSPAGDYWLDVVSYGVVVLPAAGGGYTYEPGGPDSQVAIVNRQTGERTRLLFCGTPCSYAAGVWLDDRAVQVAGLVDPGDGFHPAVWQVDLDRGLILEWRYPEPLPPGARPFDPLAVQ
jgi:hypothetical protein